MKDDRPIALFDMDGTLCDYEAHIQKSLELLRSPNEPSINPHFSDNPKYIERRMSLIKSQEDWWANMPRFELGWDILEVAKSLDFRIMILTQGPRSNPAALAGKKKWLDQHLGEEQEFTMTRDKGLVYGNVFIDDYPGYLDQWFAWRKKGQAIMPAAEQNKDYTHERVLRYDGTNIEGVKEVLQRAKDRKFETK